jgi:hypothetical protein
VRVDGIVTNLHAVWPFDPQSVCGVSVRADAMLLGIKGATKSPDTGLAGCLSLRRVKQRYSVMLTPAGLRKWVLSGEDWAEIRGLHRAEHMAIKVIA